MSEIGMTECVLKTEMEEAINKDKVLIQPDKGVADGYYVTRWLKSVAKVIDELSD